MTLKRTGLIAAGIFLSWAGVAQGAPEIPAAFHGAGCNLKYTYARAPKAKADDCIAARGDRRENEGIIEDNFIRIDKGGITGFEWHCRVKAVKASKRSSIHLHGCLRRRGDGV